MEKFVVYSIILYMYLNSVDRAFKDMVLSHLNRLAPSNKLEV